MFGRLVRSVFGGGDAAPTRQRQDRGQTQARPAATRSAPGDSASLKDILSVRARVFGVSGISASCPPRRRADGSGCLSRATGRCRSSCRRRCCSRPTTRSPIRSSCGSSDPPAIGDGAVARFTDYERRRSRRLPALRHPTNPMEGLPHRSPAATALPESTARHRFQLRRRPMRLRDRR
jgi:hypothetical protein